MVAAKKEKGTRWRHDFMHCFYKVSHLLQKVSLSIRTIQKKIENIEKSLYELTW